MKTIYHFLLVSFLSAAAVCTHGQTSTNHSTTSAASVRESADDDDNKPKRGPVFRASKDQVVAAQTLLKSKGVYSGQATGKLDAATRESIKSYQKDNGLRSTGSLNRATLEKMGIALSDKQKAIPVSESSYAKADGEKPKRGPVFRATKEQIIEAQKLLKAGGMLSGEESGKLDDPTRDGLRKYQERKGLKVTGTLNQLTLEKMGISLTERQKGVDETR